MSESIENQEFEVRLLKNFAHQKFPQLTIQTVEEAIGDAKREGTAHLEEMKKRVEKKLSGELNADRRAGERGLG